MIHFRHWGNYILFLGILIAQGKEPLQVTHIYFKGNHTVSSGKLENIINLKNPTLFSKTDFDRRILKLDAITIKNKYQSEGFLETAVKDSFTIDEKNVEIYFIIDEGKRSYVQSVNVSGNTLIKRKKILKSLGLKKNKPFNPILLKKNKSIIEEQYHRISKLFAHIDIQKAINDSVQIAININEGPNVSIGNTYLDGIKEKDSSIVYRELTFENNDLFKLDEIHLSQRRILESAQFSFVNIYPVKSAGLDSTVNMVVEVRYFPKREISSEGGFVPIEYGGLTLSGPGGFIQWKDRSLFGTTTRIAVRTSLEIPTDEGLRYPRFSMDFNFENQWLFNLRFPTKIKGIYEIYKKYGNNENPFVKRFGFNGSTVNHFSEKSYIELGISWEKFNQQDEDLRDVEQRTLSIKTKLDYSDHPLFPQKGIIITGEIESVGGPLGGNRHYQKMDGGFQYYISLPRKMVFASRIKYGTIMGWNDDYDLFEEILFEKFYLGGTKTLRGWKALQFPNKQEAEKIYLNGNKSRLLLNTELRFPMFWQLGGEVFADGGWLGSKDDIFQVDDIKWDAGTGLTYASPLGPIRLDYAYQLDNPQNWEIQLDVLYAF